MRWRTLPVLLLSLLAMETGSAAAAPAHINNPLTMRVLELTNTERQKVGLKPLSLSIELSDAAQKYSQVLATGGCFEHTCGPVANFADRVALAGYGGLTTLAENIAAGYPTPEAAVSSWMNSPGHRANLLSPNYTDVGIGLASGSGAMGTYWTEDFGGRLAGPEPPAEAPAQTPDAGAVNGGSTDDALPGV